MTASAPEKKNASRKNPPKKSTPKTAPGARVSAAKAKASPASGQPARPTQAASAASVARRSAKPSPSVPKMPKLTKLTKTLVKPAKEDAKATGMSRRRMKEWSTVSPFELKDELIDLAGESDHRSAVQLLDAGRGNPNWVATGPREAFLALGTFAMEESRRVWTMDNVGGIPARQGVAVRFERFCQAYPGLTGVRLLRDMVDFGVRVLKFAPDPWVHELVDAWLGDHYPGPERILEHCQEVVRAYLGKEVYGGKVGDTVDCFATEGGAAAICYLFDSLVTNGILSRGDTVAVMTPIFTPYLELPELARYDFDVVEVRAEECTEDGVRTWRYADSELDKLADPDVRALLLVNPSNPPSLALPDRVRERIAGIVKTKNRDLVIVTDDVYATFVPGFKSLAASCPRNTALVYSWSKHYGATGHRLGVIAVAEDNVFDEKIAALSEARREDLARRYRSLSLEPEQLRFVDRLAADSRQVALRHAAGLGTPQQCMLTLFSLFDLLPEGREYKELVRTILHRRLALLREGLGSPAAGEDPASAAYYVEIDVLAEAERMESRLFAEFLRKNYEPVDVVFRLARQASVVVLNGSGFDGPAWSVRVSLANLDDLDYLKAGHHLRAVLEGYRAEWRGTSV